MFESSVWREFQIWRKIRIFPKGTGRFTSVRCVDVMFWNFLCLITLQNNLLVYTWCQPFVFYKLVRNDRRQIWQWNFGRETNVKLISLCMNLDSQVLHWCFCCNCFERLLLSDALKTVICHNQNLKCSMLPNCSVLRNICDKANTVMILSFQTDRPGQTV